MADFEVGDKVKHINGAFSSTLTIKGIKASENSGEKYATFEEGGFWALCRLRKVEQ